MFIYLLLYILKWHRNTLTLPISPKKNLIFLKNFVVNIDICTFSVTLNWCLMPPADREEEARVYYKDTTNSM